jgi:hypothetical protein
MGTASTFPTTGNPPGNQASEFTKKILPLGFAFFGAKRIKLRNSAYRRVS